LVNFGTVSRNNSRKASLVVSVPDTLSGETDTTNWSRACIFNSANLVATFQEKSGGMMFAQRKSAVWLTKLLASRRLSATELMAESLARIATVNAEVNAIVSLRSTDDLMAEAKLADQSDIVGKLHGLPIAIKDLANVAEVPTTKGSLGFKGDIPAEDDMMVRRLRAAGAIVIGKTNVPEIGLGSHTTNPVFGATRNPYDTSRSAGGSSGGAAVALATGMVSLADGSDMMGSLRNPAAWNNVYGFRPSWGIVPQDPTGDLFMHQLATLGPMARDPDDLALMLDVMAGPDPMVPLARSCEPFRPLPQVDLTGLRVGWLADWGGAFPMEEGVIEQCEDGLRVLEDLGCIITPMPPPFSAEEMWDSWIKLRQFDTLGNLSKNMSKKDLLGLNAIWELEQAAQLTVRQIQAASNVRSDWYRACAALFASYDALVMPTVQTWPFPVDWRHPTEIAGVQMDTYHRWMQVVVPVSLIGLPSLAAPVGFGKNGLPMGFQIFGPRYSDRKLLSIGAAYHQATQWPQRRPPLDPS
jgi:amidase